MFGAEFIDENRVKSTGSERHRKSDSEKNLWKKKNWAKTSNMFWKTSQLQWNRTIAVDSADRKYLVRWNSQNLRPKLRIWDPAITHKKVSKEKIHRKKKQSNTTNMKINSINRCNISGLKMNKSKLFTLTISLLLISGVLANDQVT